MAPVHRLAILRNGEAAIDGKFCADLQELRDVIDFQQQQQVRLPELWSQIPTCGTRISSRFWR